MFFDIYVIWSRKIKRRFFFIYRLKTLFWRRIPNTFLWWRSLFFHYFTKMQLKTLILRFFVKRWSEIARKFNFQNKISKKLLMSKNWKRTFEVGIWEVFDLLNLYRIWSNYWNFFELFLLQIENFQCCCSEKIITLSTNYCFLNI